MKSIFLFDAKANLSTTTYGLLYNSSLKSFSIDKIARSEVRDSDKVSRNVLILFKELNDRSPVALDTGINKTSLKKNQGSLISY